MKKIYTGILVCLSLILGLTFTTSNTYAKTGYTHSNNVFGRVKYSTTIPQHIRGTYYSYNGKNRWLKVRVSAHAVRSYSNGNHFYITPGQRLVIQRLAFAYLNYSHSVFTFQAKAHYCYQVAFAEQGMRMSHVHYKGHKMSAIHCIQNQGYSYDLVSHKVKHFFQHQQ